MRPAGLQNIFCQAELHRSLQLAQLIPLVTVLGGLPTPGAARSSKLLTEMWGRMRAPAPARCCP